MRRKNDIVIKVLSLGVGLAIGIVLIAKVFFELSFDRFYKDIDRTYIIRTWASQPEGPKQLLSSFSVAKTSILSVVLYYLIIK